MNIILDNFIPLPLSELYQGNSNIWRQPNLVLSEAKTTLIISASGKGKSSLISMIYGLRHDYDGIITLNKSSISTITPKQWSSLRTYKLSIVFQSLKLFPKLSALDNIIIKNRLTKYKTIKQIHQLFEQLEMMPYLHQITETLSFGQQQRLAIIRSLCQPFEYIMLDEPFSHLDNANAQIAWNLIQDETQLQAAKVLITGLGNDSFIDAETTLYI